ncbi:hypothetical protein [Streptomyces sp. NPDC058683]|uniref:hypothetical protein n=1 Tax=Streptomyces sp. NPDC058683 TaxID=3346597 RepID=UPI003662BBDD
MDADDEGYQRMVRPAEAGKAQCPPSSRGIPLPLVDLEPSPVGSAKVCRRRAVTVSPKSGDRHWQSLEYGGPDGQKVCFRLRKTSRTAHLASAA